MTSIDLAAIARRLETPKPEDLCEIADALFLEVVDKSADLLFIRNTLTWIRMKTDVLTSGGIDSTDKLTLALVDINRRASDALTDTVDKFPSGMASPLIEFVALLSNQDPGQFYSKADRMKKSADRITSEIGKLMYIAMRMVNR